MTTHQAAVAERFNTVAAGHEHPALAHFGLAARRLVRLLQLQPGQRVLDAGCGTGLVAIEAARGVGLSGQVVGVDIAAAMLDQAQRNTAAAGLANVSFREMDVERLDFADGSFDAVAGGFAIFFLPDMVAAVREWGRVTRAGGMVAFSVFGRTAFEPMISLYRARLGIDLDWHRTAEPEICRDLLRQAGFDRIQVTAEQLGRTLGSPEEWWDVVSNMGTGAAVASLSLAGLKRFKRRHLAEVDHPSWLDIPVIFALAQKPAPAKDDRR